MAFCTVQNHRSNYTQVPNDAMLHLLRMKKANAFGLYVYMASKPDRWIFKIKSIARQLNWSESTVTRAMNTLEHEGYLRRTRVKGADGKFIDTHYDVFFSSDPVQHGTLIERELEIPPDYLTICEKQDVPYYVDYALSLLNEEDKSFLFKLQDYGGLAYEQIILKTITTLDEHTVMNPEGYAIAVLANEIKRAKRTYSVLLKGINHGSVQKKRKE